MNILEYDLKPRAFDGKWQLLGKVMDEENAYTYVSESGQRLTLIPEKWLTLKVYDWLLEVA